MVKHVLLRGIRFGFASVNQLGMLYTGLPQDPIDLNCFRPTLDHLYHLAERQSET